MKVAVVTPTIGTVHLAKCIDSVQNQTYENMTHYIFMDGEHTFENIKPYLFTSAGKRTIKTTALQENIGKGWYGHRVYAACSFLVNADVICYLDEDNWIEPCHVEKIVNKLEEGNDWVYSLRKIHDKDGNFLCEDNCESLGKWPVFSNPNAYHIDTSCYGVRRDVAVRIGHAWYGQWGADRQFFAAIKQHFPNFGCTNVHTVGYRLDGNPNSVTKEFFEEGNAINDKKYNGEFPWKNQQRMISVGPGISIIA
jgi:glycosyltransferase involved in cell wall biosynthesis